MSLNLSLNYLRSSQRWHQYHFSGTISTLSTYLKCAGGEAGDGVPLPRKGAIISLSVWDGILLREMTGEWVYQAGDRLSVWGELGPGKARVVVRINGMDTTISIDGAALNTPLFVSVEAVEKVSEN